MASRTQTVPSGTGAPPGRNVAVDVRGLTRTFMSPAGVTYTAVEDISFQVEAGSFVAIVGPSGCGKTTVLNMIAGLLKPTEGSVISSGDTVRGPNPDATYMFQQDSLLPWKTVFDNTVLGLKMRGDSKAERARLGNAWLERVGLAEFASHYPHQLSGGMKKRVAIAQNWIMNSDLILMDEPFSALDSQTRVRMEEDLLDIWMEERKTIVLITHDLDEAIALSDKVVVLSHGPGSRVINEFDIDLPRPRKLLDLRTDPAFAAIYETIWATLRDEVVASQRAMTDGEEANNANF